MKRYLPVSGHFLTGHGSTRVHTDFLSLLLPTRVNSPYRMIWTSPRKIRGIRRICVQLFLNLKSVRQQMFRNDAIPGANALATVPEGSLCEGKALPAGAPRTLSPWALWCYMKAHPIADLRIRLGSLPRVVGASRTNGKIHPPCGSSMRLSQKPPSQTTVPPICTRIARSGVARVSQ